MANMVSSADGAATAAGRSADLGGPADRLAFSAIRALPDVILVAAGTVRAERYRPARTSTEQQGRRLRRGQAAHPRFCIVSGSLDLDPGAAVFHPDDDRPRPLVATTADAVTGVHQPLRAVAEIVPMGQRRVDLPSLLTHLADEHRAEVVLCEGGPSLIGQLLSADLLDELCLTLSPVAFGGPSTRIASAAADGPSRPLELARVLEAEGFLLLRYIRVRSSG